MQRGNGQKKEKMKRTHVGKVVITDECRSGCWCLCVCVKGLKAQTNQYRRNDQCPVQSWSQFHKQSDKELEEEREGGRTNVQIVLFCRMIGLLCKSHAFITRLLFEQRPMFYTLKRSNNQQKRHLKKQVQQVGDQCRVPFIEYSFSPPRTDQRCSMIIIKDKH